MPSTWWDWFALPPVLAGEIGGVDGYANDSLIYPCITTLPMGFSHAVYLAQHIHEHLINTRVPLLSVTDRIRPPSKDDPTQQMDYQLNRMRHSVYIDDLNIYGTDPIAIDSSTTAICRSNDSCWFTSQTIENSSHQHHRD